MPAQPLADDRDLILIKKTLLRYLILAIYHFDLIRIKLDRQLIFALRCRWYINESGI